ncbi:uncharacterized protein [Chironomus tepperi]|uniref:uncharacterized protein n=1 Tax=Chironomus tepperi TaxID=113505 RepID=UPI00391F8E5C
MMLSQFILHIILLLLTISSYAERTIDNLENNFDRQENVTRLNRNKRNDALQKNEIDRCGTQQVFRPDIVGGNVSLRGEFPWKAVLLKKSGEMFCGGTLVSNNMVVTAAHCVKGKHHSHEFRPKDVSVLLGVFDLLRSNEVGRVSTNVKYIRIHPDWNVEVDLYDADIAVLVLEKEIQFNSYIQPVCLDGPQSQIYKAVSAVAVGFGKTETGKTSNIAKKLSVPILDYHKCSTKKDIFQYLLSPRTFCGGPGDGRGICQGDSGSGLFVFYNNQFYLRGISSASIANEANECNVNTFAVFTDATNFCGWIRSGGLVDFAICINSNLTPVSSKRDKSALSAGECLKPNEYIESANNCSKLIYQDNGELVYYEKSKAKWSSRTPGSCTNRACMEADGNFVIYNCKNKPVFVTGTEGNPGSKIILQNDGNLVVYDSYKAPIWSLDIFHNCDLQYVVDEPQASTSIVTKPVKNTLYGNECLEANEYLESPNKCIRVLYQSNGDLVYYRKSSMEPFWKSNTLGHCTNKACMQEDGNFVIYDCYGKQIFATNTANHPGSRIILQNDGNLVIYNLHKAVLWALNIFYNCDVKNNEIHEPQDSTSIAIKPVKNILYGDECLEANEYLESSNKCFRTRYQSNGDLVNYKISSMQPLWKSDSPGHCPNIACMQNDGNFVIYDCNGKQIFASNTANHPGSRIYLQDDGNLVIYNLRNNPVWQTRSVTKC